MASLTPAQYKQDLLQFHPELSGPEVQQRVDIYTTTYNTAVAAGLDPADATYIMPEGDIKGTDLGKEFVGPMPQDPAGKKISPGVIVLGLAALVAGYIFFTKD